MRIIKLDAANWKTVTDYWNALRGTLGAPDGYATSLDGMLELMIWDYANPRMIAWHNEYDKPNAPRPPYTIRILNAETLLQPVRDEIEFLIHYISKARKELRARHNGFDVDVTMEVITYN